MCCLPRDSEPHVVTFQCSSYPENWGWRWLKPRSPKPAWKIQQIVALKNKNDILLPGTLAVIAPNIVSCWSRGSSSVLAQVTRQVLNTLQPEATDKDSVGIGLGCSQGMGMVGSDEATVENCSLETCEWAPHVLWHSVYSIDSSHIGNHLHQSLWHPSVCIPPPGSLLSKFKWSC